MVLRFERLKKMIDRGAKSAPKATGRPLVWAWVVLSLAMSLLFIVYLALTRPM